MTLKFAIESILKLIELIIWPSVVMISVILLKKPIAKILSGVQEVELPGGSKIKIRDEVKKIEAAKDSILKEPPKEKREPKVQKKDEINTKMSKLGLSSSPSGLDIQFYFDLLEEDPNIALAGLRVDLEIMLKNLAYGFKIEYPERANISRLANLLQRSNAITSHQYDLINAINNICNAAIHGASVSKNVVKEVLQSATVLISDFISWLDWGFK